MEQFDQLTDLQWQLFEPLFPKVLKRSRGKPHTPWRSVVNSILFIILTQTKWSSLPAAPEYASKSAAHRWYGVWEKNGLLQELLETYKRLTNLGSAISLPKKRIRPTKVALVLSA